MKILRLDLVAFGPFTRQELSLADGDAGFHLIYGPNEAGKSSTLRALRCLLFGFPHSTGDGFLHPYKELRVGAAIRDHDGGLLECIRRKGKSNTLRGADDVEILAEDCLARLLGGVDDDAFRRQFGIDHAQLVAGGKEIVAGGGEIGQILFAAASGFAQLGEVRRRLADEADALFRPQGAVKPINRLIGEIKQQRKRVHECQLKSSQWKEHQDRLGRAHADKGRLDGEQLQRVAELNRLERIRRALPDIARREETLRELEALGEVPRLSPDFGQRRRSAEKRRSEAQSHSAHAAETLESLGREMDGLDVCEAILARQDAIEHLRNSLAIHLKGEDDSRVRLAPRRDQLLRDAEAILRDLGHEQLGVKEADTLRLSREERMRIQRLAAQYAKLIGGLEAAEQRIDELRREAEATALELERLPPPRDAAPLQRALARLQKQGDLPARCEELERVLGSARKQAEIDLKKLPLWSGTLAELELLAIPGEETIAAFEDRLKTAGSEVERLSEQRAQVSRHIAELEQRLRQLDLEHDVPTEEDLADARRRRDAQWSEVRVMLHGTEREAKDAAALAAAFERSVDEADALSDRLRREAERVGVKSQLTAEREAQGQSLSKLSEAIEAAEARRREAEDQWRSHWSPAGIEPLSPREMRGWRRAQAELASAAASLRRQESEAAELRGQVESFRGELRGWLEKLDVLPEWDDAPLPDLVEMCEATVEATQQSDRLREQGERDAARQAREIKAAEDQREQAREALEAWRSQWSAATERLRLQDACEPAVATAVLDEIDKLFAKIREAESLTAERIEPIAAEARHFAENVKTVCQAAAPDLLSHPYAKATTELYRRLEKTRQAADRLAELQKLSDREKERKAAADETLVQAQAELELLCREAGCTSPEELAAVEQQAEFQGQLRGRLEEIENRLHREAAGKPLRDFVAEALGEDADQLPTVMNRSQQEIQEAAAELEQINQTIGQETAELKRMDGNAAAAAAQEEAEQLLAQLRDEAERYIRLRLAAEVLQTAIQRHREKNQGPVLGRASELFRELTLGSFAGLAVDYNEAGTPVLMGVRSGGQKVGVEGMSDGSCDQLYLALRLASLEHYLDRHPPLPLVVDDILITFDDDRAAAALQVLGELSRRTQVLFFTHHERLVELARKRLPKRLVHFHRLPGPLDPEPNGRAREEQPAAGGIVWTPP